MIEKGNDLFDNEEIPTIVIIGKGSTSHIPILRYIRSDGSKFMLHFPDMCHQY